jgi:hypothetical protein
VAVEKLHFLQNSKNLGDRKCLGKLRKSFVGHPDTILFSRISLERVFQHPRLVSTVVPSRATCLGIAMFDSGVESSEVQGGTMRRVILAVITALVLCGVCLSQQAQKSAQQLPANLTPPAPELQSLAKAFEGRWWITQQFEPNGRTPNGGTGYGEEVWRRGPGGFTFMEEVHEHSPAGESFGLAVAWWDQSKRAFNGIWCINTNPRGCVLTGPGSMTWDGKQQVVENEFPRDGKTFVWHEVLTDITPTSFVQTADIGEKGGPLKRWLTIHATKVPAPYPEMQRLRAILLGRWYGTLTIAPSERLPKGADGHSDQVWKDAPGGTSMVEESFLSASNGQSADYATIWWNGKAKKYQGIWCADINDEGCSQFVGTIEENTLVLDGVWEQNGKRHVWQETFSRTSPTTCSEGLSIGEPGGKLTRVSEITATRIE